MNPEYLMGNHDGLIRKKATTLKKTQITDDLYLILLTSAITYCMDSLADAVDIDPSSFEVRTLAGQYIGHKLRAESLSLFESGGIPEKDHLALWCLSKALKPQVYIESGVFTGSSLHAFLDDENLERAIAIDPDLSNIRIPQKELDKTVLIADLDFSELELESTEVRALVYFDDHINTAQRIIQAHKKGLRYILFDDSTGLEGICQRAYPATPTLPIILMAELLNKGDRLAWYRSKPQLSTFDNLFSRFVHKFRPRKRTNDILEIELLFSEEFIALCQEAKSLIKNWIELPNLGRYIPQSFPAPLPDSTKYLVELFQGH